MARISMQKILIKRRFRIRIWKMRKKRLDPKKNLLIRQLFRNYMEKKKFRQELIEVKELKLAKTIIY
jgi:hypothetical protein